MFDHFSKPAKSKISKAITLIKFQKVDTFDYIFYLRLVITKLAIRTNFIARYFYEFSKISLLFYCLSYYYLLNLIYFYQTLITNEITFALKKPNVFFLTRFTNSQVNNVNVIFRIYLRDEQKGIKEVEMALIRIMRSLPY